MVRVFLRILSYLFGFVLSLTGCVTGHSNPVIDEVIKDAEKDYPADNAIEQAIEHKIEAVTGFEVDLSAGIKEAREEEAAKTAQSSTPAPQQTTPTPTK